MQQTAVLSKKKKKKAVKTSLYTTYSAPNDRQAQLATSLWIQWSVWPRTPLQMNDNWTLKDNEQYLHKI